MGDEPNTNTDPNGAPEGGGQVTAGSWFEQLPDDMKGNEAFSRFKESKSPADVLAAYAEAEGKLKGAIVPPGESATTEERQAFDAALRKLNGVPEKVEGYEIAYPEGVPQDDPVMKVFLESSHTNGLNKSQLMGVMGDVVKAIHEHREGVKLVNQEAMKGLWKEKYDENMALAIKGMEGTASDAGITREDLGKLAEELPTNPLLVRMFSLVGKYYSEDRFTGSGAGGQQDVSLADKLFPKEKMGKYAG